MVWRTVRWWFRNGPRYGAVPGLSDAIEGSEEGAHYRGAIRWIQGGASACQKTSTKRALDLPRRIAHHRALDAL